MHSKRIVFMGTPEFAASHLKEICDKGFNVVGAFSQPDKISSRGSKVNPTPVKREAIKLGIPVFQPDSVNKDLGFSTLKELNPDIIIVVAYGKILGQKVISLPNLGIFNVHASILPFFRGAAPIQRAIEEGEKKTGISIMGIVKELDAGPVYSHSEILIDLFDTYDIVEKNLIKSGTDLLCRFLEKIPESPDPLFFQDDLKASYAPKIEKNELIIDWNLSPEKIFNKIRSLDSTPGPKSLFEGNLVSIKGAAGLIVSEGREKPGTVLSVVSEGAWIKCSTGAVLIKYIKFPGKIDITFSEAFNGRKIKPGQALG